MLENFKWSAGKRTDTITAYDGSHLNGFARELAKADERTYAGFLAAMRRADPKFLQIP
jgi:hypothetical protein